MCCRNKTDLRNIHDELGDIYESVARRSTPTLTENEGKRISELLTNMGIILEEG